VRPDPLIITNDIGAATHVAHGLSLVGRDPLICHTGHAMARSGASTPAPSAQSRNPTVIYVMGAGRSGSTILGVTLGNCADFFYAGELDKWLPNAGVPSLGDAARTRFWSGVRREVTGAADLFGSATRCLERSSALFRLRRWRARRQLRGPYLRVAEDLYRAVARAAEVKHVVDTSHYPLRARELQRAGAVDLYLVFLVRDAQSVVASFGCPDALEPTFGVLKTNAYLWLTHLVSLFVFLLHKRERRVFLRFEDFIANPEGVLRGLLDQLGCSAALPDLTQLRTGLPIQGNRLIQQGVVSLETQAYEPRRRFTLTTLLQLPWTAVFSRLRPVVVASPARSARLEAS
jgi:hypothetical protein